MTPEQLVDDVPARRSGGIERPLSAAQTRTWLRAEAEGWAGCSVVEALLTGPTLDPVHLEECLRQLVAVHESLRTTFRLTGNGPVQIVHDVLDPRVRRRDDVPAEALPVLLDELAGEPFDLERGPLVRLFIGTLSDDRFVLVLSIHGLVADPTSLDVLCDQLAQLYAGGRPPSPERHPLDDALRHADRAGAQHGTTGPHHPDRSVGGTPEPLDLPWDRPRRTQQGRIGAAVVHRLGPELLAGVDALAGRLQVSTDSVFMAAYGLLLSRLSGRGEVVIGVPVGGGDRPRSATAVGCFTSSLPHHIEVAPGGSFDDLVCRVAATMGEARRTAELLPDRVPAELPTGRGLGTGPLCQVGIAWASASPAPVLGDVPTSRPQDGLRVVQHDLGMVLRPRAGGVDALFEFRSELLDRETVRRWAEHFEVLVLDVLRAPGEAVGRAELLSGERRAEVYALGHGPQLPVPVTTAHGLVTSAARARPNAPALRGEGRELTYRELVEQVDRLAARLGAAGVRRGTRVGVWLGRSVELYVALLAVLEAGAAYVPLDPDYPRERLEFMVEDAGVSLVLGSAGASDPPSGAPVLAISDLSGGADPGMRDRQPAAPDDVAYICYTSGSTGVPKGVVVEHRGVANLAVALGVAFDVRPDDRVLQFASLSFDASVMDMFVTWAAGGCLVVAQPDERAGAALTAALNRAAITMVTLPPSVIAQLEPAAVPTLRTLITGGEPCPAAVVEKWGGSLRLINAYGPTEATVCATTAELRPGDRVVVGAPIGNVRVHVMDDDRRLLPLGVVGEVHIGGVGVAPGYHDRPELTATRFVTDPQRQEQRLYRTGDLGRMLPDGTLQLLGRADDQVKLHGFRIELGEVEGAVSMHPDVLQAVATVAGEGDGARLIVYVLTVDGALPAGLRSWLGQRVPAQFVPQVFQVVEEVPQSVSGKVDRRALPAVDLRRPDLATDYVAPRTPLEARMARAWAETLGIEKVGVNDNFFDLGGSSLLGVTLAARLAADDIPSSLADLYSHQTVAELGVAAGTREHPGD